MTKKRTSVTAPTAKKPVVKSAPIDYALVKSFYGSIGATGAVTKTKYVITADGTWVDTRDLASILGFSYQRFCTKRNEFVKTYPFREESPTVDQLAGKPKA